MKKVTDEYSNAVLFLYPEQLSIAILISNLLHNVKREGTDLLNRVNSYLVFQTSFSSFLDQVIVDFSSAEQHFGNIRWILRSRSSIQNHTLKLCARLQKIKRRFAL